MENDPIMNVHWRRAEDLIDNDYNPNAVFSPEMRLLELSILKNGWIQPVLITPDDRIIDGFHRKTLAATSKKIIEKYNGLVPCAIIHVTRPEAILMTIRMNRARGTHVSFRMADAVKELANEHGLGIAEIANEIGATLAEIELLLCDGVFDRKEIKNYKYSKSWIPAEG